MAWAQGGYAGPQVLSRGSRDIGQRPGRPAGFSVYAGLRGTYETGLIPAFVTDLGTVVSPRALFGVQADFGAYGRRTWRRTTLGLEYVGNARHYSQQYFDGSDHMLRLDLFTQTSSHLEFFSRTAAGTVSRFYAGGPVSTVDLLGVPSYGIFDNRAYYLQNNTGFIYQSSPRLSFSASGIGIGVRRQSNSLVGLNGYGADGTMAYRLSRTRTIELSYNYLHYDYPRGFGDSDIHTYIAGIAQRLNRNWELAVGGGVTSLHTVGLESVAADPLTAALFGRSTTIQAFDRNVYLGAFRASLRGRFQNSSVELSYTQMPNPGNGIYLTSRQSAVTGSYRYTGLRRAAFSLFAGHSGMTSIGQSQLGTFNYTSTGVTGSYRLLRSLDATAQVEGRYIDIDQVGGFNRFSYRVSLALTWHPSEFPISF
jgi:hypothetical protein